MKSDGRRKLFVDENLGDRVAKILREQFRHVVFPTARTMHTVGMSDTDLFQRLAAADVDAIITQDRHQLVNEHELVALRESRLSWVGVADPLPQHWYPSRDAARAARTAAIIAALPELIRTWPPYQFSCRIPLQRVTPLGRLQAKPL